MILSAFLLKVEGPVSVKLRTKFYISNRDKNPLEKKEGFCRTSICFREKGRLENKKPIC